MLVKYKSGLIWNHANENAQYFVSFDKSAMTIGGLFWKKHIYYHKIINYSIATDQETIKKEFSLGKALIGGAIAGQAGILAGFFGEQKTTTKSTIGVEYIDMKTGLKLILFLECSKSAATFVVQKLNYYKIFFIKNSEE
jgi:hypothetical protein